MKNPHTGRSSSRLAAGTFLLAVSVAGCGRGSPPPQTIVAASQPRHVTVVRVVEQPLNVVLSLPGELTPYQAVALFPKVTGFVKTVRVDRGSRVRAGDVIAVLEAPELLAQRAEAQSRLKAAEAQLGVARSKADGTASTYDKLKAAASTPGVVAGNDLLIAEKTLEGDRSQVVAAQQNIETARQALNAIQSLEAYLRVTAPFAGVVTERNVHPGAFVGPTSGPGAAMPLVRLVEHDRLRLVIPVPEAYTSELKTGTTLPFSVAAYPGQTFTGTVARVAQAIDVTTRTMAIELDVANSDGRLSPGTFCQVRWPVKRPGASLLVPSGSVTSTTDRTFVVRVRENKIEWVDVRTGLTSGALVEVFGDLHAGDQIAGRGTDELRPGTEVRSTEAKPTT